MYILCIYIYILYICPPPPPPPPLRVLIRTSIGRPWHAKNSPGSPHHIIRWDGFPSVPLPVADLRVAVDGISLSEAEEDECSGPGETIRRQYKVTAQQQNSNHFRLGGGRFARPARNARTPSIPAWHSENALNWHSAWHSSTACRRQERHNTISCTLCALVLLWVLFGATACSLTCANVFWCVHDCINPAAAAMKYDKNKTHPSSQGVWC